MKRAEMENKRLMSLDALRGADMLFITGLSALIQGGYIVVCWLFLLFLYRKNVFLKV